MPFALSNIGFRNPGPGLRRPKSIIFRNDRHTDAKRPEAALQTLRSPRIVSIDTSHRVEHQCHSGLRALDSPSVCLAVLAIAIRVRGGLSRLGLRWVVATIEMPACGEANFAASVRHGSRQVTDGDLECRRVAGTDRYLISIAEFPSTALTESISPVLMGGVFGSLKVISLGAVACRRRAAWNQHIARVKYGALQSTPSETFTGALDPAETPLVPYPISGVARVVGIATATSSA